MDLLETVALGSETTEDVGTYAIDAIDAELEDEPEGREAEETGEGDGFAEEEP